jgi:hypothetical protein
MANNITGNPWSLDTTGNIFSAGVYVKNLIWANGAADGDALLIQDSLGRDIIRDKWKSEGDNIYGVYAWVQGFNLVTLASGKVFVVVHQR